MEPRLSFVTLGVSDLARATRFYAEVLELPQRPPQPGVAFFELGRTWLALFPRRDLAADAGVVDDGAQGFPRFSLAHNVRSKAEVDRLLAAAVAGGGTLLRAGHDAEWGGYTGYFADPDGFLWEVAWNPAFPHV